MTWQVGEQAVWLSGDLCALGALAGIGYLLVATVLIWRFPFKTSALCLSPQPVSILVPLCGDENGLYERLCALCRQDYAGPTQIVCGVQDSNDPAIAVVRRVAQDNPCQRIDLTISARSHGRNRKISNLLNMVPLAEYDIFVVIDSDILVGPDYLGHVVGALQRPGVGAVTCLYSGIMGRDLWSLLSAMAVNTYFVPNVVTAMRFSMARPCFGATIVLTRDMLERIGGFREYSDCLFDDYAIGAGVRAEGQEVVIPPLVLGHVCLERSAMDMMRNQLRYARTIKAIDPVGNAGAIITHPFALAAVAAAFGNSEGIALMVLAFGCRILLCKALEHSLRLDRHQYWLLPLRDLISFGVYVAAFFGDHVRWRGERYRLLANGTIVPDPR
jgi:ceramide glucosyltransferase